MRTAPNIKWTFYSFSLCWCYLAVFLVNCWQYWIQGDLYPCPSLLNHNFLTILEASSNTVYNIRHKDFCPAFLPTFVRLRILKQEFILLLFRYNFFKGFFRGVLIFFVFSLNLPHWADSVIELPWPSACVSVCHLCVCDNSKHPLQEVQLTSGGRVYRFFFFSMFFRFHFFGLNKFDPPPKKKIK